MSDGSEAIHDAISAAVHAEAEAAKVEIRAAAIVCPSCGVNMADLAADHVLTMGRAYENAPLAPAECNYGTPVDLGGFETFRAAANVMLWGDINRAMDEEFNFTGLLGKQP